MNNIKLIVVLIIVLIAQNSFSGEVTGAGMPLKTILSKANLNKQKISDANLELVLGEVTGAGRAINLDRLKYVLTKNNIYSVNNLTHVQFKHPSLAKNIDDVKSFEFESWRIKSPDIKGLIIQK